jgi:hypothetical protein
MRVPLATYGHLSVPWWLCFVTFMDADTVCNLSLKVNLGWVTIGHQRNAIIFANGGAFRHGGVRPFDSSKVAAAVLQPISPLDASQVLRSLGGHFHFEGTSLIYFSGTRRLRHRRQRAG